MSRRRRSLPLADEVKARFGINLRERRRHLGISQHELSLRAETHMTAVSALELGQRLPRVDTVIRMAGALEATPNELIEGIVWTPAERILAPGGFEAADDPDLDAEVAALREAVRQGRRSR